MAKKILPDPIRLAVIGGSGLYAMDDLSDVQEVQVKTPFGDPSDAIIVGVLAGQRIAFLPRHARGHCLTPTEVPYRANIFALKKLGVERIISISACGSLREHLHPGQIVIPDQLYDNTRGRVSTFFGRGLVAHVGVAEPFCSELSGWLAEAVEQAGGVVHRGGNFITIEGPRFSTKAESRTFRAQGFDIIGMTTSPEAYLAREAEMCYAVMAHISDYDVWHETELPVSVEMVVRVLNRNLQLAQRAITGTLDRIIASPRMCVCGEALSAAIITQRDKVPARLKRELLPLVGRYLQPPAPAVPDQPGDPDRGVPVVSEGRKRTRPLVSGR